MKIKDNIFYVGVLDKELKKFDAVMELKYGTSYNSYVIKGEKYTALIDTVKSNFFEEYLQNIAKYTDISDIQYLIVNHTEPDHSGAISKLLKLNPNIIVCGTKMAIDFVRNIINFDFNSKVLAANDSIDLGGKELKFFAFPMLHWPDSMYTYLKEDKMLFTCDSFGVHYASDELFNDLVEKNGVLEDEKIVNEYKYYFNKILAPFKKPFMQNALKKLELIPIEYICPGHGMIIRKEPEKYIKMYKELSEEEEVSIPKITICYVSCYGYTEEIAKCLYNGMKKCNVDVRIFNLQTDDIEEAKKCVATSQAVALGSPTILSNALPQVYEIVSALNPILNKGMKALSFGSFAWSGEATDNIVSMFRTLRFSLPFEPIRIKLKPSEYDVEQITKIGEEFAKIVIDD